MDEHGRERVVTLVISPVRIYREGIADGLRATGRFEPQAAAPAEAWGILAATAPALIIYDTQPGGDLEVVQSLVALVPGAPVVVLGVDQRESEIIPWAEAGASAFVGRDASLAELTRVVEAAADGKLLCSPGVAAALCGRLAALARLDPGAGLAALTPREREIARLMERGLSNKEIAAALCIQATTVKNHVHSILGKLGARRRGEAAARIRLLHP